MCVCIWLYKSDAWKITSFCLLPVSPSEPKPLPDLQCEDSWQSLLHGRSLSWGHEDLDGCHSNGCRGLHTVHELRDHWVTDLEDDRDWVSTQTPASQPELLPAGARADIYDTRPDGVCNEWTFEEMNSLGLSQKARCLRANEGFSNDRGAFERI